jgi:hypothetical protein
MVLSSLRGSSQPPTVPNVSSANIDDDLRANTGLSEQNSNDQVRAPNCPESPSTNIGHQKPSTSTSLEKEPSKPPSVASSLLNPSLPVQEMSLDPRRHTKVHAQSDNSTNEKSSGNARTESSPTSDTNFASIDSEERSIGMIKSLKEEELIEYSSTKIDSSGKSTTPKPGYGQTSNILETTAFAQLEKLEVWCH